MSQENVEIMRRCFEAFDAGDYEAALEALSPDIEYDLSHFPEGRVYRGHDGVREAFRIWMGAWEDYRQERKEFVDAGGEVIVPVQRVRSRQEKRPGARASNLWCLDHAGWQGHRHPLLLDHGRSSRSYGALGVRRPRDAAKGGSAPRTPLFLLWLAVSSPATSCDAPPLSSGMRMTEITRSQPRRLDGLETGLNPALLPLDQSPGGRWITRSFDHRSGGCSAGLSGGGGYARPAAATLFRRRAAPDSKASPCRHRAACSRTASVIAAQVSS